MTTPVLDCNIQEVRVGDVVRTKVNPGAQRRYVVVRFGRSRAGKALRVVVRPEHGKAGSLVYVSPEYFTRHYLVVPKPKASDATPTPTTPTTLAMTFDRWQRAGCPGAPVRNLKNVWPTSPHGKCKGEKAPPAIRWARKGKK